ncbi:MAG: DUF169 domain-containing protein [Deltaproteobacteria bacterium]|nr:DUF169 domain-containing protein [Deltaproteobacteria bacterium]
MTRFYRLTRRLIEAMEVPDLEIPMAGITLFRKEDSIPGDLLQFSPLNETVTSCHAARCATLGDAVYLTEENIGCIAAAISLGLVDRDQSVPLEGPRVYTEIMRENSGRKEDFTPPSPAEFTNGTVYACKDAEREEYALFGRDDSGRYRKRETARRATSEMMAIQPPTVQGVFYFSPDFDEVEVLPDIVFMSLRPVELCRVIQGYQFLTGRRTQADIAGLRAGCSDLIARPYLTGKINFSPYCLGARLIARFEADRMGLGIPFSEFEIMVRGTEESKTGFPFPRYPGAVPEKGPGINDVCLDPVSDRKKG